MIITVAGLVLVGGSAVGGIALAATGSSDSPPVHPQTTSSPQDRNGQGEDGNKQDSDHPTGKPSSTGTCIEDRENNHPTSGEREGGMPTASHSPEADDEHRSAATPTATGTHHPEASESEDCEGRD
jgi:hypothetical protein